MPDFQEIARLAEECGFAACVKLDLQTLEFLPAVRDMCAENRCGKYGKSWACPPACGPLEELQEKVLRYSAGVIVQTVCTLKNSFDWKGMTDAGTRHKENQEKMHGILKKEYPDVLTLGAGTCTICETCTYPDAPCRFPERLVYSMEACGLFVSRICKANQIPYNHGEGTVCYTGCFLLE